MQHVCYIRAKRGKFERNFHTAYIVIGILESYKGKGIGTTFFNDLDSCAKINKTVRLELIVECCNNAAKKLYEKNGFKIEGIRKRSMFVAGSVVDEFYMSRIL